MAENPVISVVVPAHNEERVLGRLLSALLGDADRGEIRVVVVANGCTDRTAEVAAGFAGVRVVSTPVPSKSNALRLGDAEATGFPRLYVDADVVLSTADARALRSALADPGVLVAGPTRVLPMDGVRWPVRWYYDVWQRLPGVRNELFGRGVVAVSEQGHARLSGWFDVMSDDLAMAMSFDPGERVVVAEARAEIRPPRTYTDLVRRRVRAMTGNAQLGQVVQSAAARPAPRTGMRELASIAGRNPLLIPRVALFLGTALLSRVMARRAVRAGDTTWLRDESSRG